MPEVKHVNQKKKNAHSMVSGNNMRSVISEVILEENTGSHLDTEDMSMRISSKNFEMNVEYGDKSALQNQIEKE